MLYIIVGIIDIIIIILLILSMRTENGKILVVTAILLLPSIIFNILVITDEHTAEDIKVTTRIVSIEGKRIEVVGRYAKTKYYITTSDGKEWQVSGSDYSVLDKGNDVTIYERHQTTRIFHQKYYVEDWG